MRMLILSYTKQQVMEKEGKIKLGIMVFFHTIIFQPYEDCRLEDTI